MSRRRAVTAYALTTLALVVLFAVFIAFRRDAALVAALSAAGTVAAGGFAALAALGSMRAAAESSATARRSREALARTVRPRISPSVSREDGRTLGVVRCDGERGAADVTAVWVLVDRETVTGRAAHLDPWRPDPPAGSVTVLAVDLGLPGTANAWQEIKMVWIEYWDGSRVGHWHDTWQIGTAPGAQQALIITDSQLVD